MRGKPVPRIRPRGKRHADSLAATEAWFLGHGLPYFVPQERAAARSALHPKRLAPLVGITLLVFLAVSVTLSWVLDDRTLAPAGVTMLSLVAGAAYALTALRARPAVTWALRTTAASLRLLLPMVTRALPLLLIFVTFLFINAEVWQVAANLDGGALWLTVVLFAVIGIGFFLVRLPEEIDRVDDELDDQRIAAICAQTPVGKDAARLARAGTGELTRESTVTGFERANLMVMLLVTQTAQVLLLALSVFGFFMLFGAIAMKERVVETWVQDDIHNLDLLTNLSVELLQVSVFLAAFSGLYFTVYVLTDETYRSLFLDTVLDELERAVAVRAAYVLARRERGEAEEVGPDDPEDTDDDLDDALDDDPDDPLEQPAADPDPTRTLRIPPADRLRRRGR